MHLWKLTAANRLECEEAENPAPAEGKVRVRVTKLMFNGTDAAIYAGKAPCRYPLVLGRYAVGVVGETEATSFLSKGTRVLLHAVVPVPDDGTQKKDFSEREHLLRGSTADGYLRDLIYLSPSEVTPLPDSVSDDKALLLHHVATARAVLEKLGVKKGQHIAVVGATVLGIVLCQLLIYQQAAPILIDADRARLEFARHSGIYYTLETDEHLMDNLASITGGRLASGAVYVTSAAGRNDPTIPFAVCAEGGNVVICGARENMSVNFALAFRKRLSIYCVSGRSENMEAAVNLIVSGAVDLSYFRYHTIKPEELAPLLEGFFDADRDFQQIDIVTLI